MQLDAVNVVRRASPRSRRLRAACAAPLCMGQNTQRLIRSRQKAPRNADLRSRPERETAVQAPVPYSRDAPTSVSIVAGDHVNFRAASYEWNGYEPWAILCRHRPDPQVPQDSVTHGSSAGNESQFRAMNSKHTRASWQFCSRSLVQCHEGTPTLVAESPGGVDGGGSIWTPVVDSWIPLACLAARDGRYASTRSTLPTARSAATPRACRIPLMKAARAACASCPPVAPPMLAATASAPPIEPTMSCAAAAGTWWPTRAELMCPW